MKTKTASVRLPKEMYEEIDNICDGIGCSRNDWIKDTLQDKLREENSQDQENNSRPGRNTTPKEITVRDIPEEEPKPNPKDPSTWKSNKKSPKQIEVIWI